MSGAFSTNPVGMGQEALSVPTVEGNKHFRVSVSR